MKPKNINVSLLVSDLFFSQRRTQDTYRFTEQLLWCRRQTCYLISAGLNVEILYIVWKIQILKLYFSSDGALANQSDNLFNYLANATLNKALIFHFKPLAALCEKDLVTTLKDFFFQSHAELNEQVWEFESEVRQKSCISFGALLDWRLIVQSHERLTWLSLQGTSGYSSRSTWQKARVLAAPTVRKPVPGISNFSPAPPVAQSSTTI